MNTRLSAPWGRRIDRSQTLRFTFEGTPYTAHPGDTIASALAAQGQWILSRSFKYHRPRGILTMAGHDANTLVQVGSEPNVRADMRVVSNEMAVTAQNTSGGLAHDRGAILDRLGRFLPVGFYYRTFFGPGHQSWRRFWEPIIRKSAGLGKVDTGLVPGHYHKRTLHCDVIVIGGGPAGLAGAATAARAGARVILVEQAPELGGALGYARFDIAGSQAAQARHIALGALEDLPNLTVLTGATCNGWFADNWLPVLQGDTLLRIRASQVVVTSGTHEQPLPFRNNDLPGIMLGSAAQRLMRLFGVAPGKKAVVIAANSDGYRVALDLAEAGVSIAALVDPRPDAPDTDLSYALGERDIRILRAHTVIQAHATRGNRHVRALSVKGDGGAEMIGCDTVIVSVGYTPGYQLPLQAGAKLGYDETSGRFTLTNVPDTLHLAGSCAGVFELAAVTRSGEIAGARAATAAGHPAAVPDALEDAEAARPAYVAALDPHPKGRDFVDFDEDLQIKDIKNAVADGYRELELVKRFTTVGMGPSQGRHSALNTARIVAEQTGRMVADIGITTARPPFGPERLGLLAGPLHTPYRLTPLHRDHLAAGANMTPVGAWRRPLYYGDPKTAAAEITREAQHIRDHVGMLDVSTLGKLAVRGPDSGAFLDRIYTMAHASQPVGRVRYCLALNEMGAIIDDGVAFRLAEDSYYVTATTGAVARVFSDMLHWNAQWQMQVDIQNVTAAYAGINLTGPKARLVLESMDGDIDVSRDAFGFLDGRTGVLAGCPVRVMRIGFTGELSFELHTPQSYARTLWTALAEAGRPHGLIPYGLEASRILRLEKGHIIIGQDTDALSTPDELGMGWALSKKKEFFVGKTAVQARRALPQTRRLCGFEISAPEQVHVKESCLIMKRNGPVGFVSSVCYSPTLGKTIGLAYAALEDAAPGNQITIRDRNGNSLRADVVAPHFFDPENTRQEI